LIYPTRAAVIATAAGAPFALAFAAASPGRWYLALAWPLAVVLLTLLDAIGSFGSGSAIVAFPRHAYVGETRDCTVTVSVSSRPRNAWIALQGPSLVSLEDEGRARVPLESGRGAILLTMSLRAGERRERTRSSSELAQSH